MSIERMQETLRKIEPVLKRQVPPTPVNPAGLYDGDREQFLSELGTMASYNEKRLEDPNYRETVNAAVSALHPEKGAVAEAPEGTIQAAYRKLLDDQQEGAIVRGLNAVHTQSFQAARKAKHDRVAEHAGSARGFQ